MRPDHNALAQQERSLSLLASNALEGFHTTDPSVAVKLLSAFAVLTAPSIPEPSIGLVRFDSGPHATATSRKPGNILLNWRKLMDVVPDVTIAGAGAVTAPIWLAPLVGLYVWNKVWRGAEQELSRVEATTLLALWKNRDPSNHIPEEDAFAKTNKLRMRVGEPPLSLQEFSQSIDLLVELDCIELDEGIIWLREWVEVPY